MMRTDRIRPSLRRFALLTLSALIVASCGTPAVPPTAKSDTGAAAPAAPAPTQPTPAPAPAPPQKLEKLTVGIVDCTALCGFRYMGIEKGYFAKRGVEVEFFQSQSQQQQFKALLSGEIDIQETNMSVALTAVSESGGNVKLKVIGAAFPGLGFVLYARKGINTARDLIGKKIGISSPGNLPHSLVTNLLEKEGLDPKAITLVPAGNNAQRIQALIAGKIDAAASLFDLAPLIKGRDDIHIPIRFVDVLPDYTQTSLIVTDETLAKKRKAIENFLIAYGESHAYGLDHPAETAQVAAKAMKQPLDDSIKEAVDLYVKADVLNPNIATTAAAVEYMINDAVATGRIARKVPVSEVYDPEPAKVVVQTLGSYMKK